ncbi:hypothetical protein PoB_001927200 [Plakobranchus ocellatus]|uniref:Uncharacterized protein n=1 Tax=Plakobranchus ocellatus TaxID=259542 RepID=A0AAV3ZE10_9GAST|nr:hypothetical protein PoB_001927200 [Plakobranchus ocellatus]
MLHTSFVAGSHHRSSNMNTTNNSSSSSSSSYSLVRFSTVTHRLVGPLARNHRHRKFAGSLRRMGDELYLRRLPIGILAAILITKLTFSADEEDKAFCLPRFTNCQSSVDRTTRV